MTKQVVLDASAVLAYLQDESGCEKVDVVLSEGRAIMSAVNYAEVVGKLLEASLLESSVKTVMGNLELHIEPLDDKQAWETGVLRIVRGNLVCPWEIVLVWHWLILRNFPLLRRISNGIN